MAQIDKIFQLDKEVREFAEEGFGATRDWDNLSQPEQAHVRGLSIELKLGMSEKTDALGEVLGLSLRVVNQEDVSLGCLPLDSGFRVGMKNLVENKVFENVILGAIALSGFCLAFEGPHDSSTPQGKLYHDDTTWLLLQVTDIIFFTIFLVECVGKIVAYGFIDTPNAYLSSVTNCFDFFVVSITSVDMVLWLASLVTGDAPPAWLTLFRLMRSLRLVRLLEHVQGLKIMAESIWRSLPACAAVMGMLLGNMLIFSIVGMNLFMGTMHTCSYDKTLDHTQCECSGNGVMVDATGAAQPKAWGLGPWTDKNDNALEISCDCDAGYEGDHCQIISAGVVNGTATNATLISRWEEDPWCEFDGSDYVSASGRRQLGGGGGPVGWCSFVSEEVKAAAAGRRQLGGGGGGGNPWAPATFNYDNFGQALASLVVLTTRQGWHELFYVATDVTEEDMAPGKDEAIVMAGAFHVIFIFINGFMLEELFIGMLIEIFSQASGTVLLTENQKKWRYLQMYVYHFSDNVSDPLAESGPRKTAFDIVTNPNNVFQTGMICVVVINVLMLIYDDNAPVRRMEGQLAFDIFNDLCVLIFTAEIVIYVLAYGWTNYVGTIQRPKNVGNVLLVAGLWIVCIHAHLQHSEIMAANPLDWIQVFQALRVWKLFEVLSHFSQLKKLVHTLKLAIPQVINVFVLMGLTYFVFGIMAMKLYGNIDLCDPTCADGVTSVRRASVTPGQTPLLATPLALTPASRLALGAAPALI